MKRVGASAHRLLDFLSLRNAQTIEPTTAWVEVYVRTMHCETQWQLLHQFMMWNLMQQILCLSSMLVVADAEWEHFLWDRLLLDV